MTSRWIGSWRISIDRRAYTASELSQHYDNEATSWQQTLARLGVTGAYQSLAEQLEERLQLRDCRSQVRVLECGAGTATLSKALALMNPQQVKVSAVDISAGMIRKTQESFYSAGLPVDARVADIRRLPHADQSQHVVIAAHVLEHLADPALALREMYRVLQPGGVIVLCCTRRSLPGRWIQMKWRTHTLTEAMLRAWLGRQSFEHIAQLNIHANSTLSRLSVAMIATKPEGGQSNPSQSDNHQGINNREG